MQTRALGHSNITIAPIVFGGNVFGWTADETTSFAILDSFVDRGFNCIDTADVYSRWVPGNKGGESETIIGNWLARTGKRDKVVVATKVGIEMGEGMVGLSKRYILEEVEASLKRLKTDYIDLYQSHRDDETVPLEETLEAYDQLIKQGKVRVIGASNYKGARLAEAIEIAKAKNLPVYQTLQPDYSLAVRKDYETDLAPVVEKYGIGVISYFSLASGFLTGKYKSLEEAKQAKRGALLEKYFDERGLKILKALEEVEKQTGVKQASIALAWLLAQPTVTAPIVSATSTAQLDSLFAAVDLKLAPQQLKLLTDASAY